MKRLILLVVAVAGMTLSGCGGMASDLYRMAQTSHDAGSCNGFKGKTQETVEQSLQLRPVQTYEEGAVSVAQYEKGNFGAAIMFDGGKVTKFFCGNRMMATGLYRQYAEALINGDSRKKEVMNSLLENFRRSEELKTR